MSTGPEAAEAPDTSAIEAADAPAAAAPGPYRSRWRSWTFDKWIELVATFVLAGTTLAVAWSGYQSARWSGVQSTNYSLASARRLDATRAATRAGQLRIIDATAFNTWLLAKTSGNEKAATLQEKRFRAEFRPAFDAWVGTDPFNDPNAPPGPLTMPQYSLALEAEADVLEAEATAKFDLGRAANQQSDDYVLLTVVLAAALFLAGVSSRFEWRSSRGAVVGLSAAFLVYGIVMIVRYPIA
jgi:hypothetical protein